MQPEGDRNRYTATDRQADRLTARGRHRQIRSDRQRHGEVQRDREGKRKIEREADLLLSSFSVASPVSFQSAVLTRPKRIPTNAVCLHRLFGSFKDRSGVGKYFPTVIN